MLRAIILVQILLLVSCSSVPLTPEGKRVRKIQPDWANTCRFITSEEINNASFGAHPGICAKRAHDAMRNRVAELGGNAYVITYETVSFCATGGTTVSFEVYSCPEH